MDRGRPFIKRRGKDVKFSWFFKGINKNHIKQEWTSVFTIVATLLIRVRINTTLLSEIKFELQSLWKWFIRRPYYYYCYQKGPVGISRPSAAESPSYWVHLQWQSPWPQSWCSTVSWWAVVHPRRRVPCAPCTGHTWPPSGCALGA